MQASELCSEGLSIRVIENLLLPEGMDGGPSEGSRGREATGKSVHNMAVRVSLRAGRQWLVPPMSIFSRLPLPLLFDGLAQYGRSAEAFGVGWPGARGRLLLRRLSRPQQSREEFFDSSDDAAL